MKPSLRILALTVLLALVAVAAHANSALFSPYEGSSQKALDPSFRALADDPATGSLLLVKANTDALNEKTSALSLTLGPGLDLQALRVKSYNTRSGSLVWSGVVADSGARLVPFSPEMLQFDPTNSVMLVKDGNTITGNVHYNGELYKIRPLHSGGHAIVAVDFAALPPDHPAEYAHLRTIPMRTSGLQTKANSIIRVMVHYTPSAASASGNISSLIDLAIAESNQGFANSSVAITFELATKAQVSYTESSFSTDLSRYRGTSDGFMDSIHTTRNSVAADVGMLVINNASSCGLASSIGSSSTTAFATAHWDCITGYYSFAHEIGHLLSARHDPATDPTNTPFAYGHGYQFTGSPSWRTIMAYNCSAGCPRLNYWSNPNKLFNGVPMGTTTRNDNARVLNSTRTTVAAFR
jgi:hypothetical protein